MPAWRHQRTAAKFNWVLSPIAEDSATGDKTLLLKRLRTMSWDISIQDLPRDVQNVADISDDYQPSPLGPRDAVIARIHEVLPDVDFSDPTWGLFDCPDFSIEFNVGAEEICDSFMLHVRGGGSAMQTVARLLQHLQLRGIDCQTGDFFSVEAAQGSFGQWQAHRDRVIGQLDDNPAL